MTDEDVLNELTYEDYLEFAQYRDCQQCGGAVDVSGSLCSLCFLETVEPMGEA